MSHNIEAMNLQKSLSIDNSPDNINFFVDFVNVCTKNSQYTLTAGAPSNEYFDIDEGLIHPQQAEQLTDIIVSYLQDLIDKGYEFDKLGFIEKAGGPVGMINLHSSIITKIKKEGIIIRPDKLLVRDTIKGLLRSNDRVLILNDVATTGETIFEAAQKIWMHGAKVPYALVFIDRLQGANENLSRKGIELFSLTTIKEMNSFGDKIKKPFHESAPIYKDFGGSSITFVR